MNPKNILIVDDTPANLRLLQGILGDAGYKVRPVPNGDLALKAIQAAPPDLILLDINMPGLSGYDVAEELKRAEETRDIPIIFISALDEIEDKMRAFQAGGVDYVTKPFHFEEVLARVKTHLNLRELQTELEVRVEMRTAELWALHKAAQRFVPNEFLRHLEVDSLADVQLGDQIQQEMTVMFADIRDFTTRSESLTPKEIFDFVNDFLSCVSPVVREHSGFIDQYLGDGIMALFPGGPNHAVPASIAMQKAVQNFNEKLLEAGTQPVRLGIGLNTGNLILGILGEAERLQGTVISDTVNVAARIQDLTKLYRAEILTCEGTVRKLAEADNHNFRFIDRVRVKGKTKAISVFEIFDTNPEEIRSLKQATKSEFEHGISHYYGLEFHQAVNAFDKVLTIFPDDAAAKFFAERAANYLLQGPPQDWSGTFVVGGK